MRGLAIITVLLALLLMPGAVQSHSGGPEPIRSRCEVTILRGEIIDPMCYFVHDARGMSHAKCAEMCAKGGQNLAFLDDATGNVYPLIAKGHGENPNTGLIPHLGRAVEVKLALYHKSSTSFAQIIEVKELE